MSQQAPQAVGRRPQADKQKRTAEQHERFGDNMAEQKQFVVITGRKAVSGMVRSMQAAGEVREATTGRIVTLPRVWAVAAPTGKEAGRGEGTGQVSDKKVHATRQQAAEELGFYRKYSEGLLRRYVQLTMEAGRVSSMMGRGVLGGKASSYRIHGFDDAVIFRLDVEKCLRQLDRDDREVIRRIAIQEYTHLEAAELMGLSLRTVGTRYGKALDRLTEILLRTRLLEPLRGCQVVGR